MWVAAVPFLKLTHFGLVDQVLLRSEFVEIVDRRLRCLIIECAFDAVVGRVQVFEFRLRSRIVHHGRYGRDIELALVLQRDHLLILLLDLIYRVLIKIVRARRGLQLTLPIQILIADVQAYVTRFILLLKNDGVSQVHAALNRSGHVGQRFLRLQIGHRIACGLLLFDVDEFGVGHVGWEETLALVGGRRVLAHWQSLIY